MNEAAPSPGSVGRSSGFLRRDAISRTAITLYALTFLAASCFGIVGWRPYAPMAFFSLIAVISCPRIYRIAGAIALLLALDAGYFEIREAQRELATKQTLSIQNAE